MRKHLPATAIVVLMVAAVYAPVIGAYYCGSG
jgi:hypothetical protein